MIGVCLLIIDDGRRDYLERCQESIRQHFPPGCFRAVVLLIDRDHRLGFTGAVREGWRRVGDTGCEWVVHAESDFVYTGAVPLERMIGVMERNPHLVQMSLLRQPVNEHEKAAGGIIQLRGDGMAGCAEGEDAWLEHAMWFTTNPSLYRVSLTDRGWPDEEHSEGKFGGRLFREMPEARSAIWGGREDRPRVWHIGAERAGHGY